ncbi:amidohydrolase family protein [Desulfatirhabdium butyrativorans]|uniref:amidohydrolase family protein n=1 Tax=Desulfatirhabdium butyrativorans TaxID=340467 RepID=UPI000489986D|nr:amidohydrolase family protein [Desulfatirhabdium butyrativorans]
MRIDIHTHIFPKAVRQNREAFFSGEAAFSLLYGSPKAAMVGAEELVNTMDEQGIEVSVTFGFPWNQIETMRMHNDDVLEAGARFPGRLIPFCCAAIDDPQAGAEARRCLAAGAKGIGELALYRSRMDEKALDAMTEIMQAASDHDVPVLIHTNEPIGHAYPGKAAMSIEEIDGLLRRFPQNRIILAHWGGGIFFYGLLKKQMKERFANVWFDTAASPFLYDKHIYGIAAQIVGADKILFGSDFPLIKPERYRKEMAESDINPGLITAIMGENSRRLLRI